MHRIYNSFQQPRQIAGKSPVLKQLYDRALNLISLQTVIRNHLQAEVFVASIDNKTLHLVTHSGQVATALRYRQRSIITLLRQQCLTDINTVKVSVRPHEIKETTVNKAPLPLTEENARHMRDTAKYINDRRLQAALIKLSQTGLRG